MTPQAKSAMAAVLFGVVAGTSSWLTGLARAMWPEHPILGALLITVFTGIVVHTLWPAIFRKRG